MLMKRKIYRKTSGFTLTEAAIVLGIMGLILGAIWVAAGAVYNNQRVATTTTQILQMVNAIRSLHATQPVFDSNTTALNLAKAGAIPSDMLTKAAGVITGVHNVWNGAVTIAQGATTSQFTITYATVPQAACGNLLVRMTGEGRDSGMISAGAGGTAHALTGNNGITVATAATDCVNATSSVQFTFELRS